MRSTALTPAALALALAVGGCAAAAPDPVAPETGPGTAGSGAAAPGAGGGEPADRAPDGRAPLASGVRTLTGESFDVATVADSPVILWFWAPWCTICRAEAPEVAEVAAELDDAGSPVVVLGVPGRGEVGAMADFVADTGTDGLMHLVDADGSLWRAYEVITQPAFALIDRDGQVEVVAGALGADGLREAAASLAPA